MSSCCSSSSSCSSSCSPAQADVTFSTDIDTAANRLADLLAQTDEYQQFLRSARLVNTDPQVRRMIAEMRQAEMLANLPDGRTADDLRAEFEALPGIVAYRKAENALRELFRAVDGVISAGAGVAFAPNAVRSSGCG